MRKFYLCSMKVLYNVKVPQIFFIFCFKNNLFLDQILKKKNVFFVKYVYVEESKIVLKNSKCGHKKKKKPQCLRPQINNPLYEIVIHSFT